MEGECIIHFSCYDGTDEPLTQPKDYDSWRTILQAAQIRDHEAVLKTAEGLKDQEVPRILYHRQCRSRFTLKRDLETLSKKSDQDSEHQSTSGESATKRQRRSSSASTSRVYKVECIFCEKEKRIKGTATREKLVQATQIRVDEHLRECAIAKGDGKIISMTSRDIVAAEAHYHRSCYRTYTRPSKLSDSSDRTTAASQFSDLETEAFNDLLSYIRNDIFPNKVVISLTKLTSRMEEFLSIHGFQISASTKKNMKRKLQHEAGELLEILTDETGKLLVVPESITKQDMVLENQRLHRELDQLRKSSEVTGIVDQASSHVRSSINTDFVGPSWPYHPSELNTNSIELPKLLERFIKGVVCGEPDNLNIANSALLKVQSICQDIIYATTRGRKKPAKHLLLPFAVKTMTGNVELIKILNRLGHGISYHQLEEIETALCLQKLAAGTQTSALPAALQPAIFTCVAWDNIDRLEETLTGKGTSHRVNGIAVQPMVYGPHPPKPSLPAVEKTRRRTLTVEHTELETYIAGKRCGPHPLLRCPSTDNVCLSASNSRLKNLLWVIDRELNKEAQTIASWTGFNIQCRNDFTTNRDVLSYLPTINAPATDMNTIFEVVKRSEAIRIELQLSKIVLVADQAIYAKVAEVVWRDRERYSNIIIRMGTFHTICNALAVLGKRFQDAGLRDLCIESGIIAEGSVTGVMEGKMYNRAVRVHKIVYEALMRLLWNEFVQRVMDGHKDLLEAVLVQVDTMEHNQKDVSHMLQHPDYIQITVKWKEFLESLRTSHGQMSMFWMSYVDFVEDILLGLIRASREGDWDLHLYSIRALIPWSFAYDRVNYARYLPAYYAQMVALPQTHPDVHEEFKNGNFSVQLSEDNPFGRVPVDQALEMTVNKDTQTPGGTTKFSLQAASVKRHYITAEYRSTALGQLRNLVSLKKGTVGHVDLKQSRKIKDEEAVSAVVNLLESWVNPFSDSQDIVSLSTAKSATPEVATALVRAKEIGEKNYKKFREERLHDTSPAADFYDSIKLNKLKTFSNLTQRKAVKLQNGQTMILKADRSLFARIMVIGQSRNLHMSEILSYPLGPLPWALATPEGLMRKTSKSTLANNLQKNVAPVENLPHNSAIIIDGMSLLHKMSGSQRTFGDVAEAILSMALRQGCSSTRIDIVFDKYNEISIKNMERQLRGEEVGRGQSIAPSQLVRQWRAFLNQTTNKSNLIEFLVKMWRQQQYKCKLGEKVMYVTRGDQCFLISKDRTEEIEDLRSTQEEADGRLLLHTAHAAKAGYKVVIICTDDTDVFVLSLAFCDVIGCQLFLKSGTRNRSKITDVQKVSATLGVESCKGLVGMHAFTGCDSISAFAGKGKIGALNLLKTNKEACECFVELGQQFCVTSELASKLEAVVCQLYAPKTTVKEVNVLRYNLFCSKMGEVESYQLPPSKDCLNKHIQRANYQSAIWRRCLERCPEIPSPVGHGWKLESLHGQEQLAIVWMDGHPAPESVLDLLSCKCTTQCVVPRCVCVANGLKCTEMCRLQNCQNQPSTEIENENMIDVSDDDLDE